jgi:deoxyadenosine/deoxycytidine kinase
MIDGRPGYIVVEGPIGVGKTTLARRLAVTLGCDLLLERPEDNPFLPGFYRDRRRAALPTQLYFLFQRARQIEAMRQGDLFRPARVTDFLLEKDRLFAEVTLSDDELDLYRQVYDRLAVDPPVPDLVIYLQAPVHVLQRRIQERDVAYERLIDVEYLEKVCNAYVNFFYHYDRAPLLIVNTADFNLASNERDYRLLLERIRDLPRGRHYFNPAEL